MRSSVLAVGMAVFPLLAGFSAHASPARFWLSPFATNPGDPLGPSTTTFYVGSEPAIHVWAQPGRNDATGMFKVLENMSLNLVLSNDSTAASAIEFISESITMHNDPLPTGIPAMPTEQRFEYVRDAGTGLAANQDCEDSTAMQGVCGMQGLTINIEGDGLYTGVGSDVCNPDDPHCAVLPNGDPAWLVASVEIRPLVHGATANLRLQIGGNGINHRGESSATTQVLFGGDNTPIYHAGSDRNTNIVGGQFDAPHLVAQIIKPDPDFNKDGVVDSLDLEKWQRDYGNGNGSDADFDGDSDGRDFLFWQRFYEGSSNPIGVVVPEPTARVLVTFILLLQAARRRYRLG